MTTKTVLAALVLSAGCVSVAMAQQSPGSSGPTIKAPSAVPMPTQTTRDALTRAQKSPGSSETTINVPRTVRPLDNVVVRDALTGATTPPAVCRVDLAITRMTLTRSEPNRDQIFLSVEYKNLGPNDFVAAHSRDAELKGAYYHGITNELMQINMGFIGQVRAGPTKSASPVLIPWDLSVNPSGVNRSVHARIYFHPLLTFDVEPCNDDKDWNNDMLSISSDTLRAWLGTASNRLDVTP